MGQRRSIREYGARPISALQLGEFLYRVARIQDEQEIVMYTPYGPMQMAIASRPYPSGGALYELEFYVWRSPPVTASTAACITMSPASMVLFAFVERRLNSWCCSGMRRTPLGYRKTQVQVPLILAARVPRISWKYASIAYSLILKHVGVVYQNHVDLAATAMNLAPCALGCGDSDAFARAASTDYLDETSVGEFLLGSLCSPFRKDSR